MQPTGLTTGAGSALASAPALLELAEGSRWRTPEVTAVLAEHAARVARDGGDEATALLAEGWLAQALATVGRGVAAVPRAVDALLEAVRTDYLPASDRLRVALAGVARSLDDRGTALLLLDPVLSRADLVPKLRADAYLEAALCQDARVGSEGEQNAEVALAALREVGGEYDDLGEAAVYAALAGQLRALRHLAAAVRHAQAGLRRVLGDRPETAAPQPVSAYLGAALGLELTLALLDQGQRDEAWEVARTVLSWDVHPGSLVPVARLRLAMAQRVHLPSGAREEALAAAQWVAAAIDQRDLPELELDCYSLLAELREERGELAEALAASRRAHAAYRTLASTVERALVLLVRSAEEGTANVRQQAGERRETRPGTGGIPPMPPGRAAMPAEGSNGGPPPWMTGGGRMWSSSSQPARPPSVQPVRPPGAISPGRTRSEPPAAAGGQIPGRPGQNVFPLYERGERARLGRWGSQYADASWRPRQSEGEAGRPTGWSGALETYPDAPVGRMAPGSTARRGGADYPTRIDLETTNPLLGRALGARPFDPGSARPETTAPDVLAARPADHGGGRRLAGDPVYPRSAPAGSPPWWSATGVAGLGPSERAGSRVGFGASGLPRPADWPGPGSLGEIGLLLGASSVGTEQGGATQPPGLAPADAPGFGEEPFSSAAPRAVDRGGSWPGQDASIVSELAAGVSPPDPLSGGDAPAGMGRSIRPDPLDGIVRSVRREPLSAHAPPARTGPRPSPDLSPPAESSGLSSWSAGGPPADGLDVAGSDPLGTRAAPRVPLTGEEAFRHDPLGSNLSNDIEPPTMFEALGGPDILAQFAEHPEVNQTVGRAPLSGVDSTAGLEPLVGSGQPTQSGTLADAGWRGHEQPDEIERHAELSLAQLAMELLGLSEPGGPLPMLIVINIMPSEEPIGGPAVSAVVRRVAAWVASQLPSSARSFPLDRGAVAVGVSEAEASTVSTWATALSSGLSARWSELAAELPGSRFHVGVLQLDEGRTVIEQLWDLHLGEDVLDPDLGGRPPASADSGGQEPPGGGRHLVGTGEVDSVGGPGHRIDAQPGSGGRRRRRDAGSAEPGVAGGRYGLGSAATGSAATGSVATGSVATGSVGSRSGGGGGGVGAGGGDLGWVGSSGSWSGTGPPGPTGRGLTASGDAGLGKAWRGERARAALGLLLGVPGDAGPRGAGGVEAGDAGVERSGGVAVGVRLSEPGDSSANRGGGGPKGGPKLRVVLDEPDRRQRHAEAADRSGGIRSWNRDWATAPSVSARAAFLAEPARDSAANGHAAHGGVGVSRGLKLLLGDPERGPIAPRAGRGVGLLPAPAVALRHSLLFGDDKCEANPEERSQTAEVVGGHALTGSDRPGHDADLVTHDAPSPPASTPARPGTSRQGAAPAADRPNRHQASDPAPERAIEHGAAGRHREPSRSADADAPAPPGGVPQPLTDADPLASAGGVPQPMTEAPDAGPDQPAAEATSGAAELATSDDVTAEPPTSSTAEAVSGGGAAGAGAPSGTDGESTASGALDEPANAAADEPGRGAEGLVTESRPGTGPSAGPAAAQSEPSADEPSTRSNEHAAAARAVESAEIDDLLRRPVSELSFAELIAGALVAYRQV